jgi:hypothetical protein
MPRSNAFLCGAITAALFALPIAAFASTITSTSDTTALTSGLVGYWSMDGSSINWSANTMRDLSGQGNTGTLVSMSTTSSPAMGKIRQALKFNGTNQYVDSGNPSSVAFGTSSFTLSTWVKTNSTALGTIIAKDSDSNGRSFWLQVNEDRNASQATGAI